MTTPEQLAKYREDFESVSTKTPMLSIVLYARDHDGQYRNNSVKTEWQGYLRRCQETEQAVKVDDHQIALLVNSLTHIAEVCHGHASLRQRISSEFVPLFQQAIKDARKQALEEAIAVCDARIKQYNAPVSEGLLSKWQTLMVKTESVGASDCKDAIQELLK